MTGYLTEGDERGIVRNRVKNLKKYSHEPALSVPSSRRETHSTQTSKFSLLDVFLKNTSTVVIETTFMISAELQQQHLNSFVDRPVFVVKVIYGALSQYNYDHGHDQKRIKLQYYPG